MYVLCIDSRYIAGRDEGQGKIMGRMEGIQQE